VTIIFGLLSAFSYGYADFAGALAAKKVRAISVTTVALFFGLLLAILLSLFVGATFSAAAVTAGLFAGISSAIAISCLYAALALGPISIVSPLTAVISALIPVVFDLATGARLGSFALVAVGLILISVVLVAFVPGQDFSLPSIPALLYSLAAGGGFAALFIVLDSAPSDAGLATLIVMRVVGIALMAAGLTFAFFKHRPEEFLERAIFSRSQVGLVFLAGLGDVTGNVFFQIATHAGQLAIASLLTSLYPVGTILLARIVLKERIAKSQSLGIVLAIGACVLIAIGKPA
jgi:drug/metabolite transporter (DMT)-like permease